MFMIWNQENGLGAWDLRERESRGVQMTKATYWVTKCLPCHIFFSLRKFLETTVDLGNTNRLHLGY